MSGAKSFLSQKDDPPCDAMLRPDLSERLRDRVHCAKSNGLEKYTMSREFRETWRQALDACDRKFLRAGTCTDPVNREPPRKSNRRYARGLMGKHKPRPPIDCPPLTAPLSAPLLPNPLVCGVPQEIASLTTPCVAISGPVVVREVPFVFYHAICVSTHTSSSRAGETVSHIASP